MKKKIRTLLAFVLVVVCSLVFQAGDIGRYWLGLQCFGTPGYSSHLYIDWGLVLYTISEERFLGFSVRPVSK